jgi:predicted HicB family RNase H-like nuclease
MSKDEKNQIVTSLRVDPELWKKAKMEAIKCDMTLGRLVDEAVRDWIERKKKGIEK